MEVSSNNHNNGTNNKTRKREMDNYVGKRKQTESFRYGTFFLESSKYSSDHIMNFLNQTKNSVHDRSDTVISKYVHEYDNQF